MSYVEIPYSTWRPQVMPFVLNAPEIMVDNAVRAACIQFCEDTHWLQYTCPSQLGIGEQMSYPVLIPSDTDLVRLQSCYYNNFPLVPQTEDTLRLMYSVDWRTFSAAPRYWTRDPDDDTSISIVPMPNVTDGSLLAMVAIIRPSAISVGTSLDLYNKWWEYIAAGAIARLCEVPGGSFSNSKLATTMKNRFVEGIGKAKVDRNRSLERAIARVRPPALF